jgi:uncharacterized protein (TIGR02145 family)
MKKLGAILFLMLIVFSINAQVQIGEQNWMTTNLNVSKFQNGDPIFEAKTKAQWQKAHDEKKPAWCYFRNNPQNGALIGKFYNWYALTDSRGLVPKGWHIPSMQEWNDLVEYLKEKNKDVNKALTSKTGWKKVELGGYEEGSDCQYCNGTGQLFSKLNYKYVSCSFCYGTGGNKRYVKESVISGNGTNSSGLSIKSGSIRWVDTDEKDFKVDLGYFATFWLSPESYEDYNKNSVTIQPSRYEPYFEKENEGYGLSIRLMKDNPIKMEKDRIAKEEIKNKTIGKPVKIGNLEFAEFDYPELMNFDDSKKVCKAFGDGWRLPTKNELNILFLNKDKISGLPKFSNGYWDPINFYWSSTEYSSITAWNQDFRKGEQKNEYRTEKFNVRAVRSLF